MNKLVTLLGIAFTALKSNRKRTILTMLGIVIGISSVITILSLGRGFEAYALKNMGASEESNVKLTVFFNPNSYSDEMLNSYFSNDDLSLVQAVEGVQNVKRPNYSETTVYQDLYVKGERLDKTIVLVKNFGSVIHGRSLDIVDKQLHRKVALVDEATASELSPDDMKGAIGQGITLNNLVYQIIGIYRDDDISDMLSSDFSDFGNIRVLKSTYRYYNKEEFDPYSLQVAVSSDYKASDVKNDVLAALEDSGSSRLLGSYDSYDDSELLDGIGRTLKMLTYFISGIAGISLLIAGIGVMNMMYTSVAERLKEIGIRRAVGATESDIRNQFLTEGLMLTVSSGVIGYIIGFLVAVVISKFLPFSVGVDGFTVAVALGVTGFIGIVFSIAPANSAARKDLVEIMRG
jgi:putative ABC transport system permease protein